VGDREEQGARALASPAIARDEADGVEPAVAPALPLATEAGGIGDAVAITIDEDAVGHVIPLPSPESITASSWSMPTIVIITGSPSGSTTPSTWTRRSVWFGGQAVVESSVAPLQSGGSFVSGQG